jgi:DNA-directed RNA polymerase specialized sigma24 family protein
MTLQDLLIGDSRRNVRKTVCENTNAMDPDTKIGGGDGRFPVTSLTVLASAASDEDGERRRACEILAGAYWKPVYKYIRLKWGESNEGAKDLTQGFFARAIEKSFFAGYDPEVAAFRTYLRMCLDRFVASERKAERRLKRSPGTPMLSLDFSAAEREMRLEPAAPGLAMEEYFHQEWLRSFFGAAVDQLRREYEARGRAAAFQVFDRYDLQGMGVQLTYGDLAGEFGIAASSVTNYLAAARRDLRRILLANLREIVGGEREFRDEARALLGIDVAL